jgi:hypothetical protein
LGLSPAFADDTTKQMQWRQFVARSQLVPDEQPFATVVGSLESFLWPPLEAVAQNLELEKHWPRGGPWT